VEIPLLDLVGSGGAVQSPLHGSAAGLDVVRMREFLNGQPLQFPACISQEAGEAAVDPDQRAVDGGDAHANGAFLEHVVQTDLTRPAEVARHVG
jgi:hypothetical protein